MIKRAKDELFVFSGPLASAANGLITYARMSGNHYNTEGRHLIHICELAETLNINPDTLPKTLVDKWCVKKDTESHKTWSNRIYVIRKLAKYMDSMGMVVYHTPLKVPGRKSEYTPHIYTNEELRNFFACADQIPSYTNCPNRKAVASLIFRLIYGCGLRLSEALNLEIQDVDTEKDLLIIRNSKMDKSRYVPMSHELGDECRLYIQKVKLISKPNDPFFLAPDKGFYSRRAIYHLFRQILDMAGICHSGKGPRIHDFRHTFAVNCLKKWIKDGKSLTSALPVLAAYLGHKSLKESQNYLRLTADMYPEITKSLNDTFNDLIPEVTDCE